ncbi:hypothetical protein MtrunA17_Chr8g0383561 [Medicago truncatula]|uniref:Uncharacterized protein n=1 Tax=Medicago truncatula TaxID=3880 RepID=G7LC75_MEDTR|nr:hypothetical protein MTR_8g092440 [Medicago truncatula]RHN43045.1 hypothetical protein MtrunA17_Chr8g0383561 [Medicago truncatula]
MNVMNYEQFDYSFTYMNQLHECTLENLSPLPAEDLLSPNTILDEILFDQDQSQYHLYPNTILDEIFDQEESMQGLLQQHTNLDFNIINHEQAMALENELCGGVTEKGRKNVFVSREEESYWNAVQEELMEETCLVDLLLMGAEVVESQNMTL